MRTYHRIFVLAALVALVLTAPGCMETRAIELSEVRADGEQRILVYGKNGKLIQFERREYQIDTTGNVLAVKGRGTLISDPANGQHTPFSGSIAFSEIDSVYAQQFGPLANGVGLGIVAAGSAIVLLLIVAWIYGPISIG